MKINQIIFFILLFFSTELKSQQESVQVIWDNVIFYNNLLYGQDDSASQVLDIYIQGEFVGEPEWYIHDSTKRKTLIHFHGGGWLVGDKNSIVGINSELVFYPFLLKGYNIINVAYRKGPGTAPEAVEDALCALGWIVKNASTYNIDPDNLVLMGESAGGHLALVAGFTSRDPEYEKYFSSANAKIRAIINIAGITDIENTESFMRNESSYNWNYPLLWIGDPKRIKTISKKYSPVNLVNKNSPPVITGHGKLDQLVPYQQAITLKSELDNYGIRNRLILFENGAHMSFGKEGTQKFYDEVFKFLFELGLDD